MRLLNVRTRRLEEFTGIIPTYAILSHTWAASGEVSFRDLARRRPGAARTGTESGAGRAKLEGLCSRAALDGYDYVWMDTCCIDKSSSAELSEAINSMYTWYRDARKCYVYLDDVSSSSSSPSPASGGEDEDGRFRPGSALRRARWFTRGWTLQELLAPAELEFYDRDWRYLFVIDRRRSRSRAYGGGGGGGGGGHGHDDDSDDSDDSDNDDNDDHHHVRRAAGPRTAKKKQDRSSERHVRLLSEITRVSRAVLRSGDVSGACVAARLAWAAGRRTTRPEDAAYCLLGLLGVNMPLLYGEGGGRAFARLQRAIVATRDDAGSLLAWGYDTLLREARDRDHDHDRRLVLARSPDEFRECRDFRPLPARRAEDLAGSAGPFPSAMTNVGLQIALPVVPVDPARRVVLAILGHTPDADHLVVVPLVHAGPLGEGPFHRALGSVPFLVPASHYCGARGWFWGRGGGKRGRGRGRGGGPRPRPRMMQILLRDYHFAGDCVSPFAPHPLRRRATRRRSLVVDFDVVVTVAGCRLVSFYPPWIGNSRAELRWRVMVDEGAGWCLLIFRRGGGSAFGVAVRPPLLRTSREAAASFGEVRLTTAVECLMRMAGEKKRGTVAFPGLPSPALELEVPGMPLIKHVLSLQVDDVFDSWLRIMCRTSYKG